MFFFFKRKRDIYKYISRERMDFETYQWKSSTVEIGIDVQFDTLKKWNVKNETPHTFDWCGF